MLNPSAKVSMQLIVTQSFFSELSVPLLHPKLRFVVRYENVLRPRKHSVCKKLICGSPCCFDVGVIQKRIVMNTASIRNCM